MAVWVLAAVAACSGGGAAATTDGGGLPPLDATPIDAHGGAGMDSGTPDAGKLDASGNHDPDAGPRDAGVADGRPADSALPDAAPVRIAITGELTGIWEGASITVRLQGAGTDDQRVTLGANGVFTFPVELLEGSPFAADVESSPALHTCTLHNQRGRAWQGTPPVQIACVGPAVQIELSTPDGFRFDPATRSYELAYSFLTDAQQLRVTGADALHVQLDGSPVPLGAWSSFALGSAPVTTHVQVGAAGVSRSFQLTFRRDRALVHAAYAKSRLASSLALFGSHVAVSHDTLVASGDTFRSGLVTAFHRTAAGWEFERLFSTPDPWVDDFGASVAVSGDTLVVGAPRSHRVVERSGAVFVYRRGWPGWVLEAALKASNPGEDDRFGSSVAIDGDTIIVGAPGEDSAATGVNGASPGPEDNSRSESGAAYVFRRSGGSWTQEAYLKASNTGRDDGFGGRVAVSGDTVAVGASAEDSAAAGVNGSSPGQEDDSLASAGAVYVFHRSETRWAQEAYVKASHPGASDFFGDSIGLSGDTLVVGAWGEDSAATGVDGIAPGPADDSKSESGAAYIFQRKDGAWTQTAYLKAANPGAGDHFGQSVAVWRDTVVVGARFEDGGGRGVNPPDDDRKPDSGAVYVFRHGAIWFQEAYLKSVNSDASDWFGDSVAVAPGTIAVGAPFEDGGTSEAGEDNSLAASGATYVFR